MLLRPIASKHIPCSDSFVHGWVSKYDLLILKEVFLLYPAVVTFLNVPCVAHLYCRLRPGNLLQPAQIPSHVITRTLYYLFNQQIFKHVFF